MPTEVVRCPLGSIYIKSVSAGAAPSDPADPGHSINIGRGARDGPVRSGLVRAGRGQGLGYPAKIGCRRGWAGCAGGQRDVLSPRDLSAPSTMITGGSTRLGMR